MDKGRYFLTDGGMETVLIFREGIDLPEVASFPLLRDKEGRKVLRDYFKPYLKIAEERGTGFVLESATWRASADWGEKLGYSEEALAEANRVAVLEIEELRREWEGRIPEIVLSGCVGPRGDGDLDDAAMSAEEAESYHGEQIGSLADAGAERITAMTLNYVDEAVGVARAAKAAGLPAVISFTVETDGCLLNGESLREAIEETDAAAEGVVEYFMINCAHPAHFAEVVGEGGKWIGRIGGIRANASMMSHAELDEAEELDEGDPEDLGERIGAVAKKMKNLRVFGGCCGTDHRHVAAMAEACVPE